MEGSNPKPTLQLHCRIGRTFTILEVYSTGAFWEFVISDINKEIRMTLSQAKWFKEFLRRGDGTGKLRSTRPTRILILSVRRAISVAHVGPLVMGTGYCPASASVSCIYEGKEITISFEANEAVQVNVAVAVKLMTEGQGLITID
jgi:hypothetical protein